MVENVDYIIFDFKGYVAWTPLPDGKFAVDPTYVKQFLKEKESRI